MSMQPPNSGYNGPSSIEQHGGDTTGARPTGPGMPASVKKSMPLGFTAGGGLLVGVIAGLVLISGGGDASEAVAAKSSEAPSKSKPATTYGDLAAEGETVEPATTADPTETDPTETDPTETDPAETDPTVDPAADPKVKPEGDPEPVAATEPVVLPDPPAVEPDPEPEPIDVRLDFKVTGLANGETATITLGKDTVSGGATTFTIPAGKSKAKVRVVVKAEGYRVFRKTLNVSADMTVPVAMRKKPAPGSGRKPRGGSGPGGLLDL